MQTIHDISSKFGSIACRIVPGGYRVREVAHFHRNNIRAEISLRMAGVTLMLTATIAWNYGPLASSDVGAVFRGIAACSILSSGLLCFVAARRGFRKELQLDLKRRLLVLGRVSSSERQQTVANVPLEDIESLYVRRPEAGEIGSTLMLRTADTEMALMRGPQDEMIALHRQLARDIVSTMGSQSRDASAPVVMERKITPRRIQTAPRDYGTMTVVDQTARFVSSSREATPRPSTLSTSASSSRMMGTTDAPTSSQDRMMRRPTSLDGPVGV